MGGHKKDPLPTILGEEGPGDSGGLPARAADSGVGENQCHHSPGWPRDHGPADGSVTWILASSTTPYFFQCSQTNKQKHHTLPCSVPLTEGWIKPTMKMGGGGGEKKEEREASENHLKREYENVVYFCVVSLDVWMVFLSAKYWSSTCVWLREADLVTICASYSHVINRIAKVIM